MKKIKDRKMTKKANKISNSEEFRVSRADLALFSECKLCYYNKVFSKINRPKGLPFVINNAIDLALKSEFDNFRSLQKPHPEFLNWGLENLVPYNGEEFKQYRNKGIEFHDKLTNLVLFGKLDDIWENPSTGELFISDYKASAKKVLGEIHPVFKMQMDIYVFIAQQTDDRFQNRTYFYYKNFIRNESMVDSYFETSIIEYVANTEWVKDTLKDLKGLLIDGFAPEPSEDCEYCNYSKKIKSIHYLKKSDVLHV